MIDYSEGESMKMGFDGGITLEFHGTKEYCFDLVMSTAMIGGKRFLNRLSRDSRARRTGNTFAAMLH